MIHQEMGWVFRPVVTVGGFVRPEEDLDFLVFALSPSTCRQK